MADRVADYSFARPAPRDVAAYYVGVVRYLGIGSGKLLTPDERDALHAAGLPIGLVWESSAQRMNAGRGAGFNDAHSADVQADALGFPLDRPIYFANDQNTCTPANVEYVKGAISASKRPVGVYGNTALVDTAHALGCRYGWKVQTWGPPTANACLQQMPNAAPLVAGTDVNDVLREDWGQWPYVGAEAPNREEAMRIAYEGEGQHRQKLVGPEGSTFEFTGPGEGQFGIRADAMPWVLLGVPVADVKTMTTAVYDAIPKAKTIHDVLVAIGADEVWVAKLFPQRAAAHPPPAPPGG